MGARSQATRIRLEALREAAAVSETARALNGGRGGGRAGERMLRALEQALERLGAAEAAAETPGDPSGAGSRPADAPTAPGVAENRTAAAAPPPPDGSRRVSVDVGPFSDFSQLLSFEDAAKAIGGAGEISIRRFSGGRASIDLDLREPVDLLRELEERCDLEFVVRKGDPEADELVLDLDS